MLNNKLLIKILLGSLILISVGMACSVGYRRIQFEMKNNTVEMIISLKDINRLALMGGIERSRLISRLKKDAGITSISLEEETLQDFIDQGRITLLRGSEISDMKRIGQTIYRRSLFNHLNKNVKIKSNNFYIFVDETALYDRIKDFLMVELGISNINEVGWNILEVSDDKDDLMGIGFGVSNEIATMLQGYGMGVIPRYKNSNRISPALIKLKILSLNKIENVNTTIFEGESILGHPNNIDQIIERFKKNGINFGYIEFSRQLGADDLANAVSNSVIRVHSISEGEFSFVPQRKAIERYIRAAKERAVRILYLRPYFDHFGGENIVEYNISFFRSIYKQLRKNNFQVEQVHLLPVAQYKPAQTWELVIMSIGVILSVIILIHYFVPLTVFHFVIFSLFSVITFYVFYTVGHLPAWNRMMAVLTAVCFPTFAIIARFPRSASQYSFRTRIGQGIIYMAQLFGITLLGSCLIIGLLSDIKYLFGVYLFFGVKISFLLPLILVTLYFFIRPHRIKSIFYVFKRVFYAPIRTGSLLAVLLCGIFVFIYILRSGNYISTSIPFLESFMRDGLEKLFWIRPRTKEFLVGYPFLFFAFVYVDRLIPRNWLWFFNALGSVALISQLNSFCHIHTPIIISVFRSILGLSLGLGLGLILVLGFSLLQFSVKKIR